MGKLKALGILGVIQGSLPNDPRKKRERKKYGTGIKLDMQINGLELSVQKETHTQEIRCRWYSTRVPRPFGGKE